MSQETHQNTLNTRVRPAMALFFSTERNEVKRLLTKDQAS